LRRCADTRALLSPSRSPHTIQIYPAPRGWISQPPALYTRPWGRSDPFALRGTCTLCGDPLRCPRADLASRWLAGLVHLSHILPSGQRRTVTPLLQWSCEIQKFTHLTFIHQRISRMKPYSRTSSEHIWNVSVSPTEKSTCFKRKQS
jgi:hypothetical protein